MSCRATVSRARREDKERRLTERRKQSTQPRISWHLSVKEYIIAVIEVSYQLKLKFCDNDAAVKAALLDIFPSRSMSLQDSPFMIAGQMSMFRFTSAYMAEAFNYCR